MALGWMLICATVFAQKFSSASEATDLYGYAPNGRPLYRMTVGAADAKTSAADVARLTFGLSGEGIEVGVWDAGAVRAGHQEFTGRVFVMDSSEEHSHATAVAGFVAAAGLRPEAQGIAYRARVLSYDWNHDGDEMRREAAAGLLVSNHSYVPITGWFYDRNDERWEWYGDITLSQTEDAGFGAYTAWSAAWDSIAYENPTYTVVAAAGNDRSNVGPGEGEKFYVYDPEVNDWAEGRFTPPGRDGGADGFDCLPASGTALNVLTVGAVFGLPDGWQGPESVRISNFSVFGPTDDGRLKPDLVAQGVAGYTVGPNTDYDYNVNFSGTSMAAPVVAGGLALVQEYARKHRGGALFSDELKALAVHAADEAGEHPGPDYRFGWGLFNVEKMVRILADSTGRAGTMRKTLAQRQKIHFAVYLDEGQSLKATAAWLNPPPQVRPLALDDPTPRLVHDLDLYIAGPDDERFFPWLLDPENPARAAVRAPNPRDNVEQVLIESAPRSGYYVVTVEAPERLPFGPQNVALVWQASGAASCPTVEIFQSDYSTLCRQGRCTIFSSSGTYAVETYAGCPDLPLTMSMPAAPELKAWPVPAADVLNVEAFWNRSVSEAALELVDVAGKTLVSVALTADPGPKYVSLSVADVPDGVYFLRVKNTGLYKKAVVAR